MLYEIPTPVLIGLLLLAMMLAAEGGLRLRLRQGRPTWLNAKEILTGLSASKLALLDLMLAFTFNQAASHYDSRIHALAAESNAIVAVGHFLDYLLPERGEEARDLLRRYTEQRIAFLAVGYGAAREREAVEHSRELAIVAREREQARVRLVPEAVLAALLVLASLAAGMLAYMAGATGHPDRTKIYALLVFVSLVVYLIVDLDRPRRGLMHLSPAQSEDALEVVSGGR